MRYTLALPTDRVDLPDQFLSAAAVARMAAALEEAGVEACHVTDHPFPPAEFVAGGGHHALDPLVTLGFAAAATRSLLLHTNVYVLAYRNPFVSAKALATLDVLSGGRLVLGVAAGYLEGEFEACGAPFESRASILEESLQAIRQAWWGEPVTASGAGWAARGNAMLPRPVGPVPIWIGGNSISAMRRAVTMADGWMPFPASDRSAAVLRTRPLSSIDDLAPLLDLLREESEQAGRSEPPTVCVSPFSHPHYRDVFDPPALLDEAGRLADLGVDWMSIRLPAPDLAGFLANVERFGTEVIQQQ